MTKKILLVGGEGYVGNVVSEYLLKSNYEVVSFDRLLYNNNLCALNHIHHPNYSFIYGDMCDSGAIESAVSGVDGVVLLAGLVGDPITKKYPDQSAQINDSGVINVINTCSKNGIEKFIFVSTCSNYGLIKNDELASEDFPLNPLSLYAKSKVSAEKHINSLKGQTLMHPTILRFATAFGLSPRMRFDLTVNEFTHDLALGKELLVFDADTWRPYCHVKDFARLIELVLKSKPQDVSFQTFNAGGEANNATKQMIVDKILNAIPDGKVSYQAHGSDPRNYKVDFSKVRNMLGFTPKYSIVDGINEIKALIESHVFDLAEENVEYHGNYEITYGCE
jgi:nucleoside-diphosphate-sugar epimerase